jgi:hypothetical protein
MFMNRWLMGGIVAVLASLTGFLIASRHQTPQLNESAIEPSTVAAPISPKPPEPVILAQVVETADIDPLLDPPAKAITGVPFDADVTLKQGTSPTESAIPERIPPAVEEQPKGSELFKFGGYFSGPGGGF